jgi:putative PIN family toxin of toxin-antitoxin system
MIRVVLDTNVVVSALIKPGSIPELVLALVLNHPDIQLCLSHDIVAEYTAVLAYGKFKKHLRKQQVRQALHAIESAGVLVETDDVVVAELTDPDDTKFVVCAVAANALYLITGNTRHFPQSAGVRPVVVTPKGFYENIMGAFAA